MLNNSQAVPALIEALKVFEVCEVPEEIKSFFKHASEIAKCAGFQSARA